MHNVYRIWCIAEAWGGQKVKGQGHRVIKFADGVGLHVDMTAGVCFL